MPRYSVVLGVIAVIATIVVTSALGLFFTGPVASLSAALLVTVAIIGGFTLQRRGIGPNRSLLKQYCLLYAAAGPVALGLMLQGFFDTWLGVTAGRQSLIGLVLLCAILWSLVLLLPRFFFSAEERAELKAKRKAVAEVEKFWATSTPVSAVPGARKLRGLFSGRL